MRLFRDIIDGVINNDTGEVGARSNLPELNIKTEHGIEDWDSRDTIPHSEFRFSFVLPRPRKERNIIIRNQLGQIVSTEVPHELIYL